MPTPWRDFLGGGLKKFQKWFPTTKISTKKTVINIVNDVAAEHTFKKFLKFYFLKPFSGYSSPLHSGTRRDLIENFSTFPSCWIKI